MAGEVFRKKSMERVSSPEKLNDYIQVTTPSMWIVIAALIILLAGVLIWGIFGKISVKMPGGGMEQVAPITFITN